MGTVRLRGAAGWGRSSPFRWPWESGWGNRVVWGLGLLLLAWVLARWPLRLAAATTLGSGLGLAALIWPPAVYPALALAVPFGPGLPLGPFTLGSTDALIGLLVGVWAGAYLVRQRGLPWRAPLVFPLALYVAAQVLSLTAAWSLTAAIPELAKWVEILLLYTVTVDLLRPTWSRGVAVVRLIVVSLVVAAALEALVGLAQFFLRIGPPQFLILGRFLRAYGTFAQPNPYAGYLGLVWPLALSLSLHALSVLWPAWRGKRPLPRRALLTWGFWPAAAGLIGLGAFASWSRGGWLGMVAAAGVVLGLRSRRAVLISAVLLLVLLLGLILGIVGGLPPAIRERFQGLEDWTLFLRPVELRSIRVTGENFALVERMAHWWAAWAMWQDAPWTGVGAGNYPVAYETYRMPGWKDPLGHAHNIVLNVLAETGLVGLAAYGLLWAWAFGLALRRLPRLRGWARAVHLGALGGLTHLTVHNLFDNLYVHGMYAYVAILLALITRLDEDKADR